MLEIFLLEMADLQLKNDDVLMGGERTDGPSLQMNSMVNSGSFVSVLVPVEKEIKSLQLSSLDASSSNDVDVLSSTEMLKTDREKPVSMVESRTGEIEEQASSSLASCTCVLSSIPALEEPPVQIETEAEEVVDTSQLKCEDCMSDNVIHKWRWCINCARVLCEECAVESHLREEGHGKNIQDYANAVRASYKEIHAALEKARNIDAMIANGNETIRERKESAVAKINRFKKELEASSEQNERKHKMLKDQLRNLEEFSRREFNAQWQSDRDGYVTDTRNISNQVNSHQTDFEKRLKQLDDVVKTAGIKLNEIFGRSMMNQ